MWIGAIRKMSNFILRGVVIMILPWWISEPWDWFWYYRLGRIKYQVFDFGNTYNVMASNGKITVSNCYGSTPEQAKELALYRLKEAINREQKEQELVFKGEGYAVYRDK
jgi:hypothetical protein